MNTDPTTTEAPAIFARHQSYGENNTFTWILAAVSAIGMLVAFLY